MRDDLGNAARRFPPPCVLKNVIGCGRAMDNDSPAELSTDGLQQSAANSLLICSQCQLVSSGARLDMVCDPRRRCLVAVEAARHDLLAAPLDDGKVAPVLDDPEPGGG